MTKTEEYERTVRESRARELRSHVRDLEARAELARIVTEANDSELMNLLRSRVKKREMDFKNAIFTLPANTFDREQVAVNAVRNFVADLEGYIGRHAELLKKADEIKTQLGEAERAGRITSDE